MDARQLALKQLQGSVITTPNGLKLYTPDGAGSYAALWMRDFSYMIEDAGDLFDPEEICACLEYLFSHARKEDGWIPDRVYADGTVCYTAGDMDETGRARANLDDNAFAVIATERYRELAAPEDGDAFLHKWHDALIRALRATPLSENGLVYNDPESPHSPYGFTDCICKTGLCAFESLIHYRACKIAAGWGDEEFAKIASDMEAHFEEVFFPDGNIFPYAATVDCRQEDVWAACYALAIGFPLSEKRIASLRNALMAEYDLLTQNGQLRHLYKDESWEKFLIDVPFGTYQNGAYWATPLKWLVCALLPEYPQQASLALSDALEDFAENGCCECINGSYRKLPDYVVSATAAYGAQAALDDFLRSKEQNA
ncbi:MAG: hypothetical protein ACOYI8_04525 [Christensenellales bacterium]|jgi:hypothetical protein